MKFGSRELAQQFLVEVGEFTHVNTVNESLEVSNELLERFIKGRESIVPKLKSFRKSQSGRESWRKNRYKYMKGIRAFHKSTEGKRFHRSLGRYLANRIVKGGRYRGHGSQEEKFESLKAISSLRTHLYIDTTYYKPLDEQVEFDLFMDESVVAATNEERRLYAGEEGFDEKDVDILCRSVCPQDLVEEFCAVSDLPFKEKFIENFHSLEAMEDVDYIYILKGCVQLDC